MNYLPLKLTSKSIEKRWFPPIFSKKKKKEPHGKKLHKPIIYHNLKQNHASLPTDIQCALDFSSYVHHGGNNCSKMTGC